MNIPALPQNIADYVAEYNEKKDKLEAALNDYKAAGASLEMACTIGGMYGQQNLNICQPWLGTMKKNLLVSAWQKTYSKLQINDVISAKDKKLYEQSLAQAPEFTIENIIATFGDYIANPRAMVLKALAEVFSDLDPAYKSHEKVKIGVKGLPKRVIISSVNSGYSYGCDKLKNIITALAQYQGHPLPTREEINNLIMRGKTNKNREDDKNHYIDRGVWLKRFKNGNGHLFFGNIALIDINKALAEYYGEVLPDEATASEAKQSTSVAKDLQYYPTPQSVINRMIDSVYGLKGKLVLEPSCGCGRILDAIRDAGATGYGIEYDAGRAQIARDKGHNVFTGNFLEFVPQTKFDYVIMNPPFYGKHYAKHVNHALKFLKEGGVLISVLPATARYDHGILNGKWQDLPTGSFSESGTNIATTLLTIRK